MVKAAPTQRTSWSERSASTADTARSTVFDHALLETRPGYASIEVIGGYERLRKESGGHRWQRIPRTEKRGRVHTSTVTIAVMAVLEEQDQKIPDSEISWTAVRGSGAGGQARNKTSNAVVMTHLPTGVSVRVETDRSQWKNRRLAIALLSNRVEALSDQTRARDTDRRNQVGSGQRGDKRRTMRVRDDRVTDHITGKKMSLRRYEQGYIEEIL